LATFFTVICAKSNQFFYKHSADIISFWNSSIEVAAGGEFIVDVEKSKLMVEQKYTGPNPYLYRYRRIQFFDQVISTALREVYNDFHAEYPNHAMTPFFSYFSVYDSGHGWTFLYNF